LTAGSNVLVHALTQQHAAMEQTVFKYRGWCVWAMALRHLSVGCLHVTHDANNAGVGVENGL
jgi:hypothetical protein